MSGHSYRTADLLPALPPTGGSESNVINQRLAELHLSNEKLKQQNELLASQYQDVSLALTRARGSVDRLHATAIEVPTKATLESMLAEANRMCKTFQAQKEALAQQLGGAETRIDEVHGMFTNAQGQVDHTKGRMKQEQDALRAATLENGTLKSQILSLTQELSDVRRQLSSMFSGDHVQDIKASLVQDNDARTAVLQREVSAHKAQHEAQRSQNAALRTEFETEVSKLREAITKAEKESTSQALSVDSTSRQADFIRTLREQCEQQASE